MTTLSAIIVCLAGLASASQDLNSVEHIIIYMQENRAFDHYFGMLKGVRGFNDRFAPPLPSKLNSFYQPTDQDDLEQYMLPWALDSDSTSAMCMDAPTMNYQCDISMWNNGRVDSWNTARDPGTGMSYFSRQTLPYYYSLYDAFVKGDQYFQSTFTATNPNRMHLFTGSNGLSVGEDAVLDNAEPRPGYNWTTMAETLEQANISWRVYQQIDNFDDNAFAWFSAFQSSRKGDPLFDKGMARQRSLIDAFDEDMRNGDLPQVSWIIAPTSKSEHASHHPAAGEDFTARILQRLQANPDVYAKSVFILNYDEGGQFFDHSWTPTPPLSDAEGQSTVRVTEEINPDVMTDVPAPIGMGYRVPLLVISPWSRGNIVLSEVLDHTSVIQLLEKRFNVSCPNISPWRRAMTGDLTSALDFTTEPDYSWPTLPDTSDYVQESWEQCELPYPERPAAQSMPVQETGTIQSRALPYEFVVKDYQNSPDVFTLEIRNSGTAGAPFILYDTRHALPVATNSGEVPQQPVRKYAVEAGKTVVDDIQVWDQAYEFTLLGPNGFFRSFAATPPTDSCRHNAYTWLDYAPSTKEVTVSFYNNGQTHAVFNITDNAYNVMEAQSYTIQPNGMLIVVVLVEESGQWYDLTLSIFSTSDSNTTAEESDKPCFERRFAGRMETGEDSISDPAMGAAVPANIRLSPGPTSHPPVPDKYRKLSRRKGATLATAGHKDAMWIYKHSEDL